ncbi:hypothetical protein CLV28_0736 [Sediminihabitans luteus]|uniref:Uncharacterized protein n=1 Tax=Sediminihabitans luteus TaxID=1138585 RepID=A0A2M9D0B1_9CELL|nr:hypothetical protein [Sediminihabitans luteus]PJJ77515.1 hypothetical protein CLV28_0736 [Sediminihabitans luteus]
MRTDAARPDRPGWGMRLMDRLYPILGPAQIRRHDAVGRGVDADDLARDAALRAAYVREVGPDGRARVVRREP